MTHELHPDLQPYVEERDDGMKVLRHPLVYRLMWWDTAEVNAALAAKTAAVKQAYDKNDWLHVIWLHERPYRMQALLNLEDLVTDDAEWWPLVRDVWTDSENIWQHTSSWYRVLVDEARPHRELLMTDDEHAALAAMPDTLTVYRGCLVEVNEDGLSYTLDRARAEWFAKRFMRGGDDEEQIVVRAKIRKANVIAYLTGRGEDEVIAHPDDLTDIAYESV